MKFIVAVASLLVVQLHPVAAGAQGAHSSHGKPAAKAEQAPTAKADAEPVAKVQAKSATNAQSAAPTRDSVSYRSPFTGYRPFALDEPMTEWRAANNEVRESGGHVGLMQGKQ